MMPPKLVKLSQIAPGRIVLRVAGQLNVAVPDISPITSPAPIGMGVVTTRLRTPNLASSCMAAANSSCRVVLRTSLVLAK